MKNKINIAELLKDCPKGTKLYSPLCGECELSEIDGRTIRILDTNASCFYLYHDGSYVKTGECLLFPSKDQRDWNKFQKTIIPKFKVGDVIKDKSNLKWTITCVGTNVYEVASVSNNLSKLVEIEAQDDWELVPDKFDISLLKPFDKVLVRDRNTEVWTANLYSHYCSNSDTPFVCIGWQSMNESFQCIPYKNNEHLLGTTEDCDEYYKNW